MPYTLSAVVDELALRPLEGRDENEGWEVRWAVLSEEGWRLEGVECDATGVWKAAQPAHVG